MAIIDINFSGITKLRDWWGKVKTNFTNINTQLVNHIAGTADKHAAEKITYTGNFSGKADVKAALDQAKSEIDTIVISASIDPEVAFARQSAAKSKAFATLGARLEESETEAIAHLADMEKIFVDVMSPPAPLTAAKGDGVFDDSPVFQACINYVATHGNGRGRVFCPAPPVNYAFGSMVTVPSAITIEGLPKDATPFKPLNAINSFFKTSGDGAGFKNLDLEGLNSALVTNGIYVLHSLCTIDSVHVRSCVNGFRNGGDVNKYLNCETDSNTWGIYSENRGINNIIDKWRSWDVNGYYGGKTDQRCEGLKILHSLIVSVGGVGIFLFANHNEVEISGCMIDGITEQGIFIGGSTAGVKITHCYVATDRAVNNTGVCVQIDTGCTNIEIDNNTLSTAYYYCIAISASDIAQCESVFVTYNKFVGGNAAEGALNGGLINDSCKNLIMTGNVFYDIAANTEYVGTASNAGIKTALIHHNAFNSAITNLNGGEIFTDNTGPVKTKNHGTGTVVGGATSVTIAHGLSFAPDLINYSFISAGAFGLDSRIASADATNFVIGFTGPVNGDTYFYWSAEAKTV
jgi:hypothetical protein